jgi:hypothetical protein
MMQPKTPVPLNWPIALSIAFVIAVSASLTLGFACAAPLAAFGAVSGLTMSSRNAILATLGAWFANQVIGCTVLGYPWAADCFAWGAVMALASVLAILAARWSGSRALSLMGAAAPVAAFAAAFVAYEATLFAAAVTFLGGTESFTIAIISRVLEINAIVMVVLLLLNRAGALAGNAKGFGAGALRKA